MQLVQNQIDKVRKGILDLKSQIDQTTAHLSSRPEIPKHVLDRVSQYRGVTEKQISVLETLLADLSEPNLSASARTVKLMEAVKRINALSTFVRDDAQELHTLLVNSGVSTK